MRSTFSWLLVTMPSSPLMHCMPVYVVVVLVLASAYPWPRQCPITSHSLFCTSVPSVQSFSIRASKHPRNHARWRILLIVLVILAKFVEQKLFLVACSPHQNWNGHQGWDQSPRQGSHHPWPTNRQWYHESIKRMSNKGIRPCCNKLMSLLFVNDFGGVLVVSQYPTDERGG